ncbi:MAG: aminoacyl-histidine dipeptidase [Bacteroidetes bacterium]|nr:aminoacyl-histidine dipeptidase [Bacteroidota bacterium]
MANPLSNLEPKAVFHNFGEICKVPHPSKKEEKIVAYIENWAKERNIAVKKDETGNLLLSKPATPGMEDRQSVCIQGHIDMVCVAEKGHQINFDNDPIDVYVDGDWVKARGTTLGGDNGIAIAMGMALLESKDIPHPAIELLCTLDEEIGLVGANGLATDLLTAKLLVNIDSEDEGVFTIGCAGGINTIAHFKYIKGEVPEGWLPYNIVVEGLKGGHSGIEINAGRANACKVLTRVLWKASENYDILLSSFNGGSKHNSIPAEATAVVVVSPEKEAEFKKIVSDMNDTFKHEFILVEPNAKITYNACEMPDKVMTREEQFKLLASFYAVAHGVLRMSPNLKDAKGNPLVQTSTNFAIVETLEDEIKVTTSQRSSVNSEKDNVHEKVKAALMLGEAVVETNDGYPAWEPRLVSPLVDLSKEVWKKMYGTEPAIETIHAGLECGIIGDKYEGMDMISIGPNLHDVHSPAERLSISSTKKVWDFLCELMKNIPKK